MSTRRLSVNLSSNKPLSSSSTGGVFVPPRWDDLANYPGIVISVSADTKMSITLYESPNEADISNQTEYIIDANQPLNLQFNLNAVYFKLKLVNLENIDQTVLNLQTIYTDSILQVVNKGQFKIWDNKSMVLPDSSAYFNSNFQHKLFTFYGNSSEITNLIVQYSNDGIQFYDSQTIYTMSTSGNFGFSVSAVCKYIRLRSSAVLGSTITCYLNYQ